MPLWRRCPAGGHAPLAAEAGNPPAGSNSYDKRAELGRRGEEGRPSEGAGNRGAGSRPGRFSVFGKEKVWAI